MKRYHIAVRFAFDGYFIVSANSLSNAKQKISESCGLALGGGIHSTLPDEQIEWNFPVHPEMSILHASQIVNQINETGEDAYGKFS
jgi:hypothetical protein